jgi:hypothetical protein
MMAIQPPAPKVILLGGNHLMQTGWKRMSKLPAFHDRASHETPRVKAGSRIALSITNKFLTPAIRLPADPIYGNEP